MAHLTKPQRYDIADSNIALLGSELEKRVHEHAGDAEPAWQDAGLEPGIQIWRVEQFQVKAWPKDKAGMFYNGDSYIVLHTYKVKPDSLQLSYDLHFWLGEDTSQDEAGTAAYKTVELDDHLRGIPIQYREVEGEESAQFLSYFPHFHCMQGGVATGFHHVSQPPVPNVSRLFAIKNTQGHLAVYQIPLAKEVPLWATVLILDKLEEIWQFNRRDSHGKERFKAAEFVRLLDDSKSQSQVKVFDEGGHGAGIFLSELGAETLPPVASASLTASPAIFQVVRQDGKVLFSEVSGNALKSSLNSNGIFIVDATSGAGGTALYVWVGGQVESGERKFAMQYGQTYLHQLKQDSVRASIVRVDEGRENEAFLSVVT